MTVNRRDLLRFWRRPDDDDDNAAAAADAATPTGAPPADAPPAAPGFSLDAFYARRDPAPRELPVFAVRAAPEIATTRTGVGRLDRVDAAGVAPATPLPAGTAPRVLRHACLALTSFCAVCVERCPVPGAIVVEAGWPRVVADRCDGCGTCVAVCPAPILALAIEPRPPAAPTTEGGDGSR